MSSRLVYFDILKFTAIYLVIWGHAIASMSNAPCNENVFFLFIYSFHMPLFMIISGYFFQGGKSLQLSYGYLLIDKARHLLLPAFVWGVFIASCSMFLHIKQPISEHIGLFFKSLFSTYWFLKCLFMCYMLGKFASEKWGGYLFAILISQFLPIYRFEIMFPCFIAGMLYRRFERIVLQSSFTIVIIMFLVYLLGYLYLWKPCMQESYNLLDYLTSFSAIGLILYRRLLGIVIGVSASIMLILCFNKMNEILNNKNIWRDLSAIGKYTLGIYIIQDIILIGILSKIIDLENLNIYLFSAFITPFVSILVLVFSYKATVLFKQNNHTALFLLGEK